jgi:hypothetical protein
MTRPAAWLGTAIAAIAFACSSTHDNPAPADAGSPDAATLDAGHESGSGFPVDEAGPSPPADAARSECDQLRAQTTALGLTASACNPAGASECNASIDGICCPITVSISSTQAVNDFTEAVRAYKAKCTPDCSKILCSGGPSMVCDGTGTNGVCR